MSVREGEEVARRVPPSRRPFDRRLLRNVLALSGAQIVSVLFPLVTGPYLFRVLGAGKFGQLAFAQACASILVLCGKFGFDWSASREVAEGGAGVSMDRLAGEVIAINVLMTGAPALAVLGASFAVGPLADARLLLISLIGMALGSVLYPSWAFIGRENLGASAAVQSGSRVLALLLVFVLVRSPDDATVFGLILSAQWVLAALVGWRLAVTGLGLRPRAPTPGAIARRLRSASSTAVSSIIHRLYATGNTFLLGLVAPFSEVGLYGVAERVTLGAQGALGPVPQAVLPRFARSSYRGSEDAARLRRAVWIVMLSGGAGVALALILLGPMLGPVLFGPEFQPAVPTLRIVALSSIPSAVGYATTHLETIPIGDDRALRRAFAGGAAANLTLVLGSGRRLGALGAAWALTLAESVVALLLLRAARQARRPCGEVHFSPLTLQPSPSGRRS